MARLFDPLQSVNQFNHLKLSTDYVSPTGIMTAPWSTVHYRGDGNSHLATIDTVVTENGGMTSNLTAGNYSWTVPATGKYLQFFHIRIDLGGSSADSMFIYVNGSYVQKIHIAVTYGDRQHAGYIPLNLNEGDYVQIRHCNSTAAARTWGYEDVNGGTYGDLTGTFFMLARVDDNWQNNFLEGSFFLGKTETYQLTTANVETVFDDLEIVQGSVPKNATLSGNQTITIDKAGEWVIGGFMHTAYAQHQRTCRIKKNGSLTYTAWLNGYNYTDNTNLSSAGFMKQLTLAEGDTLDFYWHSNTLDRIFGYHNTYPGGYYGDDMHSTGFWGLRISA